MKIKVKKRHGSQFTLGKQGKDILYPFAIEKFLHRVRKIHFMTRLQVRPCSWLFLIFQEISGSCSHKIVVIEKCMRQPCL